MGQRIRSRSAVTALSLMVAVLIAGSACAEQATSHPCNNRRYALADLQGAIFIGGGNDPQVAELAMAALDARTTKEARDIATTDAAAARVYGALREDYKDFVDIIGALDTDEMDDSGWNDALVFRLTVTAREKGIAASSLWCGTAPSRATQLWTR